MSRGNPAESETQGIWWGLRWPKNEVVEKRFEVASKTAWKENCEYLKGAYSKWWERLQQSYENRNMYVTLTQPKPCITQTTFEV